VIKLNELIDVIRNKNLKNLISNATKQYITLLEESDDGMTLIDEMGHLELFNSAMEKLTGYSQKEAKMFIDFTLLMYPDSTSRKQVLNGFSNLSKSGDTFEMETTITTKDKKRKSVLVLTKLINLNKRRLFLSTYHAMTQYNPIKIQFGNDTNGISNDSRIFTNNEQEMINNDCCHQNHIYQSILEEKHLMDQQTESHHSHLDQDINFPNPETVCSNEPNLQPRMLQRLDNIKEKLVTQYIDLFDFAPVGYFILDCQGRIQKVNLTGKCLLGHVNTWLINKQFMLFVSKEFRCTFNKFLDQVFIHKNTATCETVLLKNENLPFWVRIIAKTVKGGKECYIVVMDIDERKKTEKDHIKQLNLFYACNLINQEAMKRGPLQNMARTFLTVAEVLTLSTCGFIGQINKNGFFDVLVFSNPEWDDSVIPTSENVKMFQNLDFNGLWGKTLKVGISKIVNTPRSDSDEIRFLEGFPLINSYLGVPLKHNGRILGMIALANKQGGYNPDDQRTIEILSQVFVGTVYQHLS
jgi:PAS domain S-box-containing protein